VPAPVTAVARRGECPAPQPLSSVALPPTLPRPVADGKTAPAATRGAVPPRLTTAVLLIGEFASGPVLLPQTPTIDAKRTGVAHTARLATSVLAVPPPNLAEQRRQITI